MLVSNHRVYGFSDLGAGNTASGGGGGGVCGAIDPSKPWSLTADFVIDDATFSYTYIIVWVSDDDGSGSGTGFFAGCDVVAGTTVGPPPDGLLYTEQSDGSQGDPIAVSLPRGVLHTIEVRFNGAALWGGDGKFQLYLNGTPAGLPRTANTAGVAVLYPSLFSVGAADPNGIKIHRIAFHGSA